MNLLNDRLSNVTFERTIDWTVAAPFLVKYVPEILTVSPKGELYCRSVEFPTSDITIIDDNLGIPGSFKSTKTVPEVRFEVYSDHSLFIETALKMWCEESYNGENGSMPLPFDNIQKIFFRRYSPIDAVKVLANLVSPVNTSFIPDIPISHYAYDCLIENAPRYVGTDSAELRVIEVILKVVKSLSHV